MTEIEPKPKRMRLDETLESSLGPMESLLKMMQFQPTTIINCEPREERELRKERGDRLLQLFKQQPCLSSTASARKIEKNIERAAIWEGIARKINEEFGQKLEVLTTEKVKKLLTYYKKKDEGNFDNIKSQPNPTPSDSPDPVSSLLQMLAPSTDSALPLVIAPPFLSSPSMSSSSSGGSPSLSAGEQAYFLKKERHEFVVHLAEFYTQRLCFDNSSRSAHVNAERHNMWMKITQEANDRYSEILGGLGIEQAKKLYSNCKRRRKMKNESGTRSDTPNSLESLVLNNRTSEEPEDDDSDVLNIDLQQVVLGIERENEICQLKELIVKKDERIMELEELLKKVVKSAKTKTIEILDEIKSRVECDNY